MEKNRIGIDIGGTSIKAGVIAPNGHMLAHRETATPLNPHQGMDQIKGLIGEWLSNSETTIGVAAPGPMDLAHGTFLDPPNLKGWHGYCFVDQFEKKIGKACLFENDANAAAVGEYFAGAGKDAQSMAYITISTGIGAGIVLNGQLLTGAQFSAGEVGNMIISGEGPTQEGLNTGSWESLASGTAIKKRIQELYHSDGGAQELLMRVNKGEIEAIELFQEWIGYLAAGIANLIHVVNPAVIVLGGGVMQGKDVILPALVPAVKERVYASLADSIDIRPALLSTKAGVVGASYLPHVKRL
ncbi:ROK family protein [Salipaludibacillus keqinensis]|nr:ROK family protein [Salipaludibacillus keqinensis]